MVYIDDYEGKLKLELKSGDFVAFKEIQGMTELNDTPPRPIRVLNSRSFTIEDTSKFSEYSFGGIVDQVKIPRPFYFKSFKENLENVMINDFKPHNYLKKMYSFEEKIKYERNDILHLSFLALFDFFSKNSVLPRLNNEEDSKNIVYLVNQIHAKLKNLNINYDNIGFMEESIIHKVSRYARSNLAPVNSFLGGIVAQECFKSTHKYTPINQWFWFDFFEVLECIDPNLRLDCSAQNSRYDDQIAIFGKSVVEKLSKLNLALFGAGSLGTELVKNLGLMGVGASKGTKILISDENKIEESNLSRMIYLQEQDIGKAKVSHDLKFLQSLNEQIKPEELIATDVAISRNSLGCFHNSTEDYLNQVDLVINTFDSPFQKKLINMKCNIGDHKLIDVRCEGNKGQVRVVLPKLSKDLSIDDISREQEEFSITSWHCFPTEKKECIMWGKKVFDANFNYMIKNLRKIISNLSTQEYFEGIANLDISNKIDKVF